MVKVMVRVGIRLKGRATVVVNALGLALTLLIFLTP